jgi:hypothetical protein
MKEARKQITREYQSKKKGEPDETPLGLLNASPNIYEARGLL